MTVYDKYIKRLFDIIVSSILLLVCSPILLVSATIVVLSTRRNFLFSQKRVGMHGKYFIIYKLRTMYDSKDNLSTITCDGDVRITPIGKWLRKYKIDELPQLWNVLKGDMSLVGPRPDVPGYADRLRGDERLILTVRPGITGPATLKYRDEEILLAAVEDPQQYNDEVIFPDKVQLNVQYVREWGFSKDIKYLLKTFFG